MYYDYWTCLVKQTYLQLSKAFGRFNWIKFDSLEGLGIIEYTILIEHTVEAA